MALGHKHGREPELPNLQYNSGYNPAPTIQYGGLDNVPNDFTAECPGHAIETELSHDETTDKILDNLTSDMSKQGNYHFDRTGLNWIRSRGIPKGILDQYQHLQCKTFVGLLPEINRAYITVDEKIFLWNYTEGSENFQFYKLPQVIISCALVCPKPTVFHKDVRFLLAVATTVEVVLLGLEFQGDSVYGELTVYPTKFRVPSDNVHMLKIVSTPKGRIFMCGKDGCVHELLYQAQAGWLTSKCRKVNHSTSRLESYLPSFLFSGTPDAIVDLLVDSSRHVLYTLSNSSSIQAFSVGTDGSSLSLLCHLTRAQLLKEAGSHMAHLDTSIVTRWKKPKGFEVAAISIVPRAQSDKVVLCATLKQNGTRLYLYMSRNFSVSSVTATAPRQVLKVKFIRLCPRYISGQQLAADQDERSKRGVGLPGLRDSSPQMVYKVYSHAGVLLLAEAQKEDRLVAITELNIQSAARATTLSKSLEESVESKVIRGRITDIKEVPPSFYMDLVSRNLYARGHSQPVEGLSEFAIQHALPPRKFLCMTSSGLYTLSLSRPIDQLRQELTKAKATRIDRALARLKDDYGLKEVCAMCLLIICGASTARTETSADGHSYSPQKIRKSDAGAMIVRIPTANPYGAEGNAVDLRATATMALFRYGSHCVEEDGKWSSGIHRGLALYLSRLLRPMWPWPICRQQRDSNGLCLRFSSRACVQLQQPLERLQAFVRRKKEDILLPTRPDNLGGSKEAYSLHIRKQASALRALLQLLDVCVEAMALLSVLAKTPFAKICARLSDKQKESLKNTKFSILVTEDTNVVQELLSSMLLLGHQDQADWVSELHRSCPHFFAERDFLLFQGDESVAKARRVYSDTKARKAHLAAALQHYQEAARNAKFNIDAVCRKLRDVHDYVGQVQLCLFRASHLPPRQQNSSFSAAAEKEKCYRNVTDTLSILYLGTYADPEEAKTSDEIKRSSHDLRVDRDKVVQLCLGSRDEQLHACIYQWFIDNNKLEDLYKIKSPFLVRYLSRDQKRDHLILLKDYYIKNSMFPQATLLLQSMALRHTKDFTLDERNTFLVRALGCASMCVDDEPVGGGPSGAATASVDSELVFWLKDKQQICQMQLELQEAFTALLKQVQRDMVRASDDETDQMKDRVRRLEHKIQTMHTSLMDVDTLYQEAEIEGMWKPMLAIIDFEGEHRNRGDVIRRLWRNIIRSAIMRAAPHNRWTDTLGDLLKDLCKQYMDIEPMFPLESIVLELESLNARESGDDSLEVRGARVTKELLDAKVPPFAILAAYDAILDPVSHRAQEHKHNDLELLMLWSVYHLLKRLKVRAGGFSRKSSFLAAERIGRCLVKLNAINHPKKADLERKMDELQAELNQPSHYSLQHEATPQPHQRLAF